VIRKHPGLASRRNLVPGLCLIVAAVLLLFASVAHISGSIQRQNAFFYCWFTLAGLYFVASFASAFTVAKREGWSFLPSLPIVFAIYHLSYALGFVLALIYRPATGKRSYPMRKVLTAITR
jgi:hypothetical protein